MDVVDCSLAHFRCYSNCAENALVCIHCRRDKDLNRHANGTVQELRAEPMTAASPVPLSNLLIVSGRTIRTLHTAKQQAKFMCFFCAVKTTKAEWKRCLQCQTTRRVSTHRLFPCRKFGTSAHHGSPVSHTVWIVKRFECLVRFAVYKLSDIFMLLLFIILLI